MIIFYLKDVLIASIGSMILFAMLTSFNLSKYTSDHTLLLFSFVFVVLSSGSVRRKICLSLKINMNDVNYKGILLCGFLFIILFLVSDSRDGASSYSYSFGLFLRAVLLSPLCEEVFFRAIIFGYLISKTSNLIFSSIITSISFSYMHDFEVAYYTFFISFLLCLIRHYSMSILLCVIFHSLHNLLILTTNYV